MSAVTEEKKVNQVTDVCEYIELLKDLTDDEKMQVKGIMIGMQMTREKKPFKTACCSVRSDSIESRRGVHSEEEK